jgi:hypothetical protein
MFNCEKCGYFTKFKCNYKRHMVRKSKCGAQNVSIEAQNVSRPIRPEAQNVTIEAQNVSRAPKTEAQNVTMEAQNVILPSKDTFICDECQKVVLRHNYRRHVRACKGVRVDQCMFCRKVFSTRSGKSRHQKLCEQQHDTTRNRERNESVHVVCPPNIVNNINITNVVNNHIHQQQNVQNITIQFGNEHVSHLLKDQTPEIQKAIRSIVDSIDLVHFNKDCPENQTVRKLNKKSNMMEFKTGDDRWEHECCKTGIPKLRHNLKERLNILFEDNNRFTDPDLRELLYYKSIRGCVDASEVLTKYSSLDDLNAVDSVLLICNDACDNIKSEFFRTVSPNIQTMPCVVQDLQRQLNAIRDKHKQPIMSMNDVIRYAFHVE